MLQKFLRRSFRRSSKDLKHENVDQPRTTKILERSQSLPSEQVDLDVTKSPSITSERGDISCRKVTFKESIDSPEKAGMEGKDTGLFDDSVLEAFQVGNLSIAEFLQSPHTSPKSPKNKKSPSKRDFPAMSPKQGVQLPSPQRNNPVKPSKREDIENLASPNHEDVKQINKKNFKIIPKYTKAATFPRKKLSLLDQAHSSVKKRFHDTDSLQDEVFRDETTPTPPENIAPSVNEKHEENNKNISTKEQTRSLDRSEKARFSKSLETLAQQVFGEDYETYLHSASKSPVKFSIITAQQESLDSCGSNATRSNSFDSKSSDANPNSDFLRPLHRRTPPVKKERQKLKKMPHSLSITNENRIPITEQRFVRSFDKSAALEIQQPYMESWNNELDLRSHSMDGSPCEYNGSVGSEYLGAINEEEVPQVTDAQKRKRAKSLGALKDVYALKTITSPTRRRIPKSDSQIVQLGSFSENDLSASESSFINIQFPPPPPASDMCDLTDPNFDAASFSSYDLDDSNDPLISSLMTIVPLPNDHDKLVPILSNALSEIVTEIVASRRKLNNVIKAIHIHQQILKDQCRQIKNHHKEITELKRTAYALNNYQMLYRYDKNSKNNSARSSRQSRDMVELNYTLDKLLEQCSTMQQQSNDVDCDDSVSSHITETEHEYDTLPEVTGQEEKLQDPLEHS